MKKLGFMLFLALVTVALVAGCGKPAPTPAFTPQPTSTPTPTMRLLPTATPTFTPWPTATILAPTPTPTPVPLSVVLPTPAPSPTPVNPGTTVTMGSAELSVGSSGLVPLTAWHITDPKGLGAFEVAIKYDPKGIKVEEVQSPQVFKDSPQSFTLFVPNINPTTGEVKVVALQANMPGPTGDVLLAYLSLTGLKAGVWPLEVRIDVLANSDGKPISASGLQGVVTVR